MNSGKANGTRIDEIASGIYRISTPVPPRQSRAGSLLTSTSSWMTPRCSTTRGREKCSLSSALPSSP